MKYCPDLYQLLYRNMSSDGAHATINSLTRFVETDATGRITGFKVAPDTGGLVEALSAACLLFIWAAQPFAEASRKRLASRPYQVDAGALAKLA
jgi:hypothetical protein